MKSNKDLHPFRWVPEITSLLLILSAVQIANNLKTMGIPFSYSAKRWLFVIGLWLIAIVLLSLKIIRQPSPEMIDTGLNQLERRISSSKILAGGLLLLFSILFSAMVLLPIGNILTLIGPRWTLFWILALLMVYPLKAFLPHRSEFSRILIAGLLIGFVHRIAAFIPDLSTHPFSLGWSETSRYYYASLFFSESLYGREFPLSVLHPTRYLMQSVPFLIPQLGLFAHRLWQVLLWLGLTIAGVLALNHRLGLKGGQKWWLLLFWGILFLFQGPVYYHLMVIVVIVLLGTRTKKPWITTLVVVIASLWAGVSRLNWFPVPGMIAASLYIMETTKETPSWRRTTGRNLLNYWLWPVSWVIMGTVVAFLSQQVYIDLSGNSPELFASSLSSSLLWYRLFPSSTYPLGVLLGTLLASAAPFWLIIGFISQNRRQIHVLRWLGLLAMLAVLMVGGLMVSAKIGGGSNLHNLDAYLVLLWVVAVYVYVDAFKMHAGAEQPYTLPRWMLAAGVLIPVIFSINLVGPLRSYDPAVVVNTLDTIQQKANRAQESGDEILFIAERQLITFDYLDEVQMVDEYEKVFLMEMAMAGNRDYLDRFQQDIANQRFSMIVSDPLFDVIKDRSVSWGEENNAWVEEVSIPILCYYFRDETFSDLAVQILLPRNEIGDCQFEMTNEN